MSSHNNSDVCDDPTETGIRHGAYPDKWMTRVGLTGTERRMKRRGQTITDEPLLRGAITTSFSNVGDSAKLREPRICAGCGKQYYATGARQRFCSPLCRREDEKTRGYNRKGVA